MLNFLIRTEGSPIIYGLKAFGTALLGAVASMVLFVLIIEPASAPEPAEIQDGTITVLLVIWPIIVTGLIALTVSITKRVTQTYWHAAAATAALLTVSFGILMVPEVGAFYAWPLFIFTVAYLAWQLKSTLEAWCITCALQAAVNCVLLLLII